MSEIALHVDGLSVERGGVEVLTNLSFEVPTGGTLCLLGANGAGKSTAVDAICGLAKKRGGRVFHKGTEITNSNSHQIVRGGLAQDSQNRDLFPQMSNRGRAAALVGREELALLVSASRVESGGSGLRSTSDTHSCREPEDKYGVRAATGTVDCCYEHASQTPD